VISVHEGWPKTPPPPFRGKIEFVGRIYFTPAPDSSPYIVGHVAFKLRGIKALGGVPVMLCPGERKGVLIPDWVLSDAGEWVSLDADQRADFAVGVLDCPVVMEALSRREPLK
jgi:hypothetical protein